MRLISPLLDAEVAGTTSGDLLEVNAWRGGALLEQGLAVTGWNLSWDATRQVQGQGTFTVADPDGRLAPWGLADALGPGGSRLQVTWVSGLSGIRVPLGWWRIRRADPAETWRLIPTRTPHAALGTVVAHTNLATNPDAEAYGAVGNVRINYVLNPEAATDTGFSPGGAGTGGTSSAQRVAGAGYSGRTAWVKTWSVAPTALGNVSIDFGGTGPDAATNTPLPASTVFTHQVRFWAPVAGTYSLVTVERNAGGTNVLVTYTPHVCVVGWNLLTFTGTSQPTTALVRGSLTQVSGALPTLTTQWRVSEPMVERVGYVAPYVAGSLPAAGDFTYAWSGTANASSSLQQAPTMAGASAYNGNLAVRWSSVGQRDTGARSLACMPVQAANSVGFIWTTAPVGLGQVLTAIVRVKAPVGVVLSLSARTSGGGAQGTVNVTGTGAWQTVTMSTAAATEGGLVGVQVYNAAPRVAGPAGTFYVDRLIVVVGASAYTGPWFSGASPATSLMTYAWTGAANASTSTATPTVVTYTSSVVRVSGGGSVQVQADEETATVALQRLDAEVVTAATCLAEIRRLLADIGPVTVLGGVADGPVPAGLVYGDSRSDAVDDLLTSVLAVMRMGADGSFEVVPARGIGPVWTLAGGDAGVLVNTVRSLSDDGVYNAATSTGETATGQPLVGRSQRPGGPLAWGGPYGKVPVFHRAVAQTAQGVQADADTVLATLSASGEVDLAVTCLAHPGVQPNDRVTVLAPSRAGDAPLEGRVVGMTLASAGSTSGTTPAKAMGLTVRVPADALESVARRVARTRG